MKKKNILCILIVFLLVFGVWFLTRPKSLGNMTQTCKEATTNVSNISFAGEEDERIKFSFKSDVEEGKLDIILYDSNGNVVYELDKAKALETFYTLEKSDTYVLAAECDGFVGNYKIVVYEVE